MVKIGIVGATGYLGSEVLRLAHGHPKVDIAVLASSSQAGKKVSEVLPWTRGVIPNTLVALTPQAFAGVDVVFLAAPHGEALKLAPALLAQGNRVVDLSGDHRLAGALATQVYGHAPSPEVAREVVYGLPEVNAAAIKHAKLVANPGCYPTAAALSLLPLAKAGLIEPRVIVDAKSGVSGAGREPSSAYHYPEANESVRAYKVGEHRHEPEIAQTTGLDVTFTPHLVPMNRGIQSTAYATPSGPALTASELDQLYAKHYDGAAFVRVVSDEPDTKWVRGTNFCDVKPHVTKKGAYIVTAAIDNLLKGGSGQAIQNLNLMCGFPEDMGLPKLGGVP